jgi:hypothetical protein
MDTLTSEQISVLATLFAAVSAAASALAIFASWLQSIEARKVREADLVLSFVDRYKSLEVGEALRLLSHWRYGPDRQKSQEVWEAEVEQWNQERRNHVASALELDSARRVVKSYFEVVARLYRAKYISKKLARDAADYAGIWILWDVCEPMERVATPNGYRKWIYETLRPLPIEYATRLVF